MQHQRSRRRAQDLIVIVAVVIAAFCLGRLSGEPGRGGGEAWAEGPPARGFPVNAGQQRMEMLEELRAIRRILEGGLRPAD